jgi:hypothetical protein
MGAYFNNTGKIFVGWTLASVALGLYEKWSESSSGSAATPNFEALGAQLKLYASERNSYFFEETINEHIPNMSSADRRRLWISSGGDPADAHLIG